MVGRDGGMNINLGNIFGPLKINEIKSVSYALHPFKNIKLCL